jgi:hypothetical protein
VVGVVVRAVVIVAPNQPVLLFVVADRLKAVRVVVLEEKLLLVMSQTRLLVQVDHDFQR